ncbi:putative glutamine amidotransferase [Silvimonas terrae]|uniref:gamma-glutamyl-gamma-aminobutyrate hydrolase n=1 Tax=Silvimonas terrae TaxID=300266 RepID=A0A840RAY2_9NEIS|nr:gamma-glutamyl-gamma-aminobutyrate hydrolase family protein [Silvimonas terrae]MBB5189698.1 putative glutamine amidotransferase [Silvimonas terrae]
MSKPNPHSGSKPVVGVIADLKMIGLHPFHCAGNKYVVAAVDGADTYAVVLPALSGQQSIEQTLALCDGLMFTGSPSNVEPHHYSGPGSAPGTLHDPARDATSLPLIRAAIDAGVPVFGICRGFQEINVALGGTLYQKVHEVTGMMSHREREEDPLEVQYGPAHEITIVPDGKLAGWYKAGEVTVNSLHNQGVQQLAPSAQVEAIAPDGLVEAFSVKGAKSFAFAVQWHPEWLFANSPLSVAMFEAFGAACRQRRAEKEK